VIDPLELTNDIAGDVALLALPALLWALVYLLAWEHGRFAESLGFGRRTFWLLLPGALLATLVLLPLAPIANDWLSISFAGALFPLLVVGGAFARIAPPVRHTLPTFVLLLTIESVALLAIVVGVAAADVQVAGVVAVAAAVPLVAGLLALRSPAPGLGRIAVLLGLTSGVLVVTFLSSAAIPGVGIEEFFPEYLVAPAVAGIVIAAVAPWAFSGAEALALPSAYLAGTLGVLVGADVLREPPLYGTGPAGLYAIGGAGVLDLVYLSGLLALGGAFLAHRALGRDYTPAPGAAPEPDPTPMGRLARAYRHGARELMAESIAESSAASRAAADQARRLLDLPEAPADRPWQGLPVPGWVVSDQANLDSAARTSAPDGKEAFRAFLTARWLVLVAHEIGARRYAPGGTRAAAFGIDLAIVTAPAAALWTAIVLGTPGTLDDLAGNIGFNVAIYGYAALAFLYFALAETFGGRTLGKRWLGLEVRTRHFARPSFLAALVRNTSKLPTLTLLGIGLAIGILLLLKSGGATFGVLDGVALSAGVVAFVGVVAVIAGGIGLFGAIGVLLIAITAERQRFGDLAAGTWVVRASPTSSPAAPPAPTPSGAPPGAPPPG
jgi:uncharacterized RDD family membrane protein YckC